MKKVLVSFGVGYHARLLGLSCSTFYLYAKNHSYDFFIPNESLVSDKNRLLHPSWWKLDIFQHLFKTYDQILWLDADVIVCRFENDIANDIPENSDFGVVVHKTPDGEIPNCGVWFLNKSSSLWLDKLYDHSGFRRSDCWWEQAALMSLLGVNPDQDDISLPNTFPISWTQLDYHWNPHINDNRKIPQDARFFHATCFNDRYAVMKNILNQINI